MRIVRVRPHSTRPARSPRAAHRPTRLSTRTPPPQSARRTGPVPGPEIVVVFGVEVGRERGGGGVCGCFVHFAVEFAGATAPEEGGEEEDEEGEADEADDCERAGYGAGVLEEAVEDGSRWLVRRGSE